MNPQKKSSPHCTVWLPPKGAHHVALVIAKTRPIKKLKHNLRSYSYTTKQWPTKSVVIVGDSQSRCAVPSSSSSARHIITFVIVFIGSLEKPPPRCCSLLSHRPTRPKTLFSPINYDPIDQKGRHSADDWFSNPKRKTKYDERSMMVLFEFPRTLTH